MTLPLEIWLVVSILGFYLYDSMALLFFNELIYLESFGKWSFYCPTSRWRWLGKSLFLPNPLAPYRPLFHVSWPATSGNEHNADQLHQFFTALKPVQYLVTLLAFLMLIGLPFVLIQQGTGLVFLVVVAVIYLIIAIMLALIYWKRTSLYLSNKALIGLIVDALACPPFALNTVRKISAQWDMQIDPLLFAQQAFAPVTFHNLIEALHARMEEALELEEEKSPHRAALEKYRNRLVELTS